MALERRDDIIAEFHDLRMELEVLKERLDKKTVIDTKSIQRALNGNGYEVIGFSAGVMRRMDEIQDQVAMASKHFFNLERRLTFYYTELIRKRFGYTMKFHDDITHHEDRMFHDAADFICDIHNIAVQRVDFHMVAEGLEFDCIAIGRLETPLNNHVMSIGIEFKDNDIDVVIDQAMARRGFTNLQYVVTSTSPGRLVSDYSDKMKRLRDDGIGVVSFGELENGTRIPILLIHAKTKKDAKVNASLSN